MRPMPRRPGLTSIYTAIYTSGMGAMRAKLFRNGGSQAVRLPRSCRFPDDQTEVVVRREGRRVILEPADEWPAEFVDLLGSWKEDIPRLPQEPTTEIEDPFR